jgi:hypothetical protein
LGTKRRDDNRITAFRTSGRGLSNADVDISIVSPAPTTVEGSATEDSSVLERTSKQVDKSLIAREKRRRHPPGDRPFRP